MIPNYLIKITKAKTGVMKQVAYGRWRQEDQEFKANLNKIMSSMEVRAT